MTPIFRLHAQSRQTRRSLLLLVAIAAGLRASLPWAQKATVAGRTLPLIITLAAATVIATSTRTPFGELEVTGARPLGPLRLRHLLILLAPAFATLGLALAGEDISGGAATVPRNLAGLTGIALLTAYALGASLSWTAPLAYVTLCAGAIDLGSGSLWAWPTLPATNVPATLLAACLLTAGTAAVARSGARDQLTDPP